MSKDELIEVDLELASADTVVGTDQPLLQVAGAFLWAGAYVLVGYLFRDQLEDLAQHARTLGGGLAFVLAAAFAAWLGWMYFQRQRFLRDLRVARISPEDLQRKLEAGEPVVVVDLRGALDFEADPRTLPGALRVSVEELAERHDLIPPGPGDRSLLHLTE